jgi:hypothetical protein
VLKYLFKLRVLVCEETELWFSTHIIDLKMDVVGTLFDMIVMLLIISLRYYVVLNNLKLFEFCCSNLIVRELVNNMNVLFALSLSESMWFLLCLMMTSACRIE